MSLLAPLPPPARLRPAPPAPRAPLSPQPGAVSHRARLFRPTFPARPVPLFPPNPPAQSLTGVESLPKRRVKTHTMLISKKHRTAVYKFLFSEGVCYAEKDFNCKHPEIRASADDEETLPNLEVIKLMQSLTSKELVTERYSWRHFYWFLTDAGIDFLREYLNVPEDVVPATMMKTTKTFERGPPSRPERGDRDGPRGGAGGYRRVGMGGRAGRKGRDAAPRHPGARSCYSLAGLLSAGCTYLTDRAAFFPAQTSRPAFTGDRGALSRALRYRSSGCPLQGADTPFDPSLSPRPPFLPGPPALRPLATRPALLPTTSRASATNRGSVGEGGGGSDGVLKRLFSLGSSWGCAERRPSHGVFEFVAQFSSRSRSLFYPCCHQQRRHTLRPGLRWSGSDRGRRFSRRSTTGCAWAADRRESGDISVMMAGHLPSCTAFSSAARTSGGRAFRAGPKSGLAAVDLGVLGSSSSKPLGLRSALLSRREATHARVVAERAGRTIRQVRRGATEGVVDPLPSAGAGRRPRVVVAGGGIGGLVFACAALRRVSSGAAFRCRLDEPSWPILCLRLVAVGRCCACTVSTDRPTPELSHFLPRASTS